jgi:hypothetical protein
MNLKEAYILAKDKMGVPINKAFENKNYYIFLSIDERPDDLIYDDSGGFVGSYIDKKTGAIELFGSAPGPHISLTDNATPIAVPNI